MKKIYCLSLLLCVNVIIFACEEQERPKRLQQKSQELSPTRDKNNPPHYQTSLSKSGNGRGYCRNHPDNFPWADFSGLNCRHR